jgi:hypothetical protein
MPSFNGWKDRQDSVTEGERQVFVLAHSTPGRGASALKITGNEAQQPGAAEHQQIWRTLSRSVMHTNGKLHGPN